MFEKVNPSHPDKVADRIAGAIVDLCYAKNKTPKVACEVLIGHGECNIQVETSEQISAEDIEAIVRRIAGEGIETRALIVPQDIHLAANQQHGVRCGDNGIFRGVPPTHEQKLLTAIAASIYDKHPTDGKYIIQEEQMAENVKNRYYDLTICQSHMSKTDFLLWNNAITKDENDSNAVGVDGSVITFRLGKDILIPKVNPLGEWTGGPNTDSGATNRKLGSDMGDGVTGGGLHGKDLSKADVSVNIWCYLESIRTGHEVTACCNIGDESVGGVPYAEIVEKARLYIHTLGGFEKFACWGLIRPNV